MYKNIYEKYHAAYNELKKNFSDHNKYQFDKNPTGFYMTFITWCEKYQAAKNFDFDNFDHERAYEFKQLLKDPIKPSWTLTLLSKIAFFLDIWLFVLIIYVFSVGLITTCLNSNI